MSVQSRLGKLEAEYGSEATSAESEHTRRWNEAYSEIALTMDAHDFAGIHTEIVGYYKSGGSVLGYTGRVSFLAARVLSLVSRAANGIRATLQMPPALAQAWNEHEKSLADATQAEKNKASEDFQVCVNCGAEHPFRGHYEWSREERQFVLITKEQLIKTCLLCGGTVGRWYGNGFLAASRLA
jgi:hypothetical protein